MKMEELHLKTRLHPSSNLQFICYSRRKKYSPYVPNTPNINQLSLGVADHLPGPGAELQASRGTPHRVPALCAGGV